MQRPGKRKINFSEINYNTIPKELSIVLYKTDEFPYIVRQVRAG